MTDTQRLLVVRAIHTGIYVVMAVSTLVLLYTGITGAHGPWLSVALGLLGIEVVVFAWSSTSLSGLRGVACAGTVAYPI